MVAIGAIFTLARFSEAFLLLTEPIVFLNDLLQLRPEHALKFLDKRVQVERSEAGLGLAGRGQKLPNERGTTGDGVANDLDRLGHLLRMFFPILQPDGVAEDNGEDVVEIMGDAAGEGAEAFHFLRLDQLLLEALAIGVVKEITLHLG